jgi:hypothetical protein
MSSRITLRTRIRGKATTVWKHWPSIMAVTRFRSGRAYRRIPSGLRRSPASGAHLEHIRHPKQNSSSSARGRQEICRGRFRSPPMVEAVSFRTRATADSVVGLRSLHVTGRSRGIHPPRDRPQRHERPASRPFGSPFMSYPSEARGYRETHD